jgi:hypothetical protein
MTIDPFRGIWTLRLGACQTLDVQMSEFWAVIRLARADATSDDTDWPDARAIGAALTNRLSQLPLERIVGFDQCYARTVQRAHQWDLCAAAFVMWNYISDDGFSDFKAGLVGLGENSFERVVSDPDTLADHPLVRSIAHGRTDPFVLMGEAIQFAASAAYERCTDDADAFWDAVENLPPEAGEDQPPSSQHWSGRFGDPDDAARIPLRLPRLHQLFASAAHGSP